MTAAAAPAAARPADGTPTRRAALGERLAALLDGAAPRARPLVSATVPAAGVDPISLVAAALEADLETALWLRPSEGTAFVGVGRAWATEPRARSASARPRPPGAPSSRARAWTAADATARGDGPGPARRAGLHRPRAGGRRPVGPVRAQLAGAAGAAARRHARRRVADRLARGTRVRRRTCAASSAAGSGSRRAPAPSPPTRTAWWRCPCSPRWHDRRRAARPTSTGAGSSACSPARSAGAASTRWSSPGGSGLRSPVELDVPNALRRLAASAPESTTYAFRRGGRTFLGATPERLVRTEGRVFRTVAVAGTIRRGADAAEDERAGPGPPGVREGPRGARDRRRLHPRAAAPGRGHADRGPGARRHDPALRPAPGHGDRRDRAGRARPARARRAPPPDARRRRRAARRRAGARRRARGLRPRLVRGPGRLAGRRRRRRAVRRAALRDRGPDQRDAVRRLRHRRRLRPGPRVGGVADQAARRDLRAGHPRRTRR